MTNEWNELEEELHPQFTSLTDRNIYNMLKVRSRLSLPSSPLLISRANFIPLPGVERFHSYDCN